MNSQLGFAFVILYARLKEPNHTEDYMLQFHVSIGGQDKAFCQCNNLPLVSTGRSGKKNKRQCMREGCLGQERYICSSFQCDTRIYKICFDKFLAYPYTFFKPPGQYLRLMRRTVKTMINIILIAQDMRKTMWKKHHSLNV